MTATIIAKVCANIISFLFLMIVGALLAVLIVGAINTTFGLSWGIDFFIGFFVGVNYRDLSAWLLKKFRGVEQNG